MRKKLFDNYVELDLYHLAIKQLYKRKLISSLEYRAAKAKLYRLEMNLIIPKQSKSHPRTLTRVK